MTVTGKTSRVNLTARYQINIIKFYYAFVQQMKSCQHTLPLLSLKGGIRIKEDIIG